MTLVRATSLPEAADALRELPGAVLISGGTEVMVALAEQRLDPAHLVSLRRVPDLRGVARKDDHETVLGALTTYSQLAAQPSVPDVLRAMAPTVGSPASRNAGTLGGALGTGSGAGDACTALLALDAQVLVSNDAGQRRVPVRSWLDGSERQPGDIVTAVSIARTQGTQHYLKPGERQAVSYATVSCALVVDAEARAVRCALGSVGPVPWRAVAAERWLAERLSWAGDRPVLAPGLAAEFAAQVRAELPLPAAGLRVSAEHRRHVAGVLAARALARASATESPLAAQPEVAA